MIAAGQLWNSLTTPLAENEEEARRERMTRVVYAMVSVGFLLISIIVPIYDFSVGEPTYTATLFILSIDGLLFGGWTQILRGHWRLSRYLLPVIFLALSAYTIINFGLITTGVLHLVIAVVLTSMLFGSRAQWVTVIVSEVMYLATGWLTGERDFEVFFMGGVAVGFALSGIAALQWYAASLLDTSFERLRRAETAARGSAEKIRAIFESITDGITITDLHGTITDLNEATVRMHGFKNREELIGSSAFDLIANLDRPKALENLQATLIDGSSGQREYKFTGKDARDFDAELNAVLIRNEENQPVGFVALTRDITPRKQAEAEREKLIRELEEKNKELESFTYTVSHDLKAPLITIAGFLGYLGQDAIDHNLEKIQVDIQYIQRAVTKMQRLLDELLELSRIGRLVNLAETVPFEDVVRDALEIVRGRLEARGVTIQIQPNLPAVCGDRQRLIEVLQNLVDNAAKFMGSQPDPQVEIGQRGGEEGQPVFYVRDNGIGIAPEHYERIFGLFNKLESNTEGTGVGLAIVKKIVEVHGGRIWVESEAGKGAMFCFTLGKGI
ncbi:MAG: PAS domain-containing sensor histidine kinase [Chloroflexi bacterium]|nr:MAG: PAS domain-containing sensor histidine kinase [Chloroflexota bacterium]